MFGLGWDRLVDDPDDFNIAFRVHHHFLVEVTVAGSECHRGVALGLRRALMLPWSHCSFRAVNFCQVLLVFQTPFLSTDLPSNAKVNISQV